MLLLVLHSHSEIGPRNMPESKVSDVTSVVLQNSAHLLLKPKVYSEIGPRGMLRCLINFVVPFIQKMISLLMLQ